MPIPAMLWVRSWTELYSPIRPTPAGPSSKAIVLARTMLTTIFTTDDPPTIADDFKICR